MGTNKVGERTGGSWVALAVGSGVTVAVEGGCAVAGRVAVGCSGVKVGSRVALGGGGVGRLGVASDTCVNVGKGGGVWASVGASDGGVG